MREGYVPPTSPVSPSSTSPLPNCSLPLFIAPSVGKGGRAPSGSARPEGSIVLSLTSEGKSEEGGAEVKGARRRAYDRRVEGVREEREVVSMDAREALPDARMGEREAMEQCSVDVVCCQLVSSVERDVDRESIRRCRSSCRAARARRETNFRSRSAREA